MTLLRLASLCIVQTRKIIAPSIAIPSGQITIGIRVYDVAVAAAAQNSKEAIALRSPGSAVKARRPSSAAAMSVAIAMKPRIRGTIMGIGQEGVLFLTSCKILIRR